MSNSIMVENQSVKSCSIHIPDHAVCHMIKGVVFYFAFKYSVLSAYGNNTSVSAMTFITSEFGTNAVLYKNGHTVGPYLYHCSKIPLDQTILIMNRGAFAISPDTTPFAVGTNFALI